jgi:hypothetical protein
MSGGALPRRFKTRRFSAKMSQKPLKNASLTFTGDSDDDSGRNTRKIMEKRVCQRTKMNDLTGKYDLTMPFC